MSAGQGCIYRYYERAYDVANFGGATSEDECNGTASSASELVDRRANTSAKLSALDGGRESGGRAGKESNGGSELHVCGRVVIGVFDEVEVRYSLMW